jgi:hypothetical protein
MESCTRSCVGDCIIMSVPPDAAALLRRAPRARGQPRGAVGRGRRRRPAPPGRAGARGYSAILATVIKGYSVIFHTTRRYFLNTFTAVKRLCSDLTAGSRRRLPWWRASGRCRGRCPGTGPGARAGAVDRTSPNFMGLASLGLEIGTFCDLYHLAFSYRSRFLGLDFLGLALSRTQAKTPAAGAERRPWRCGRWPPSWRTSTAASARSRCDSSPLRDSLPLSDS